MRLMTLVILVLILLPVVSATTFVDAQTGDEIATGILRLEWDNTRSEQVLGEENALPNETNQGLLVLINTNGSETYNYYAHLPPGRVPPGIVLHESGLLLGTAKDLTDNLLVGKEVRLSCPKVQEDSLTDVAGQFRLFLPTGTCTVTVSTHEYAGSAVVSIEKGKMATLELLVDQPLSKEEESFSYFWLTLFVVCLIILLVWYIFSRPVVNQKGVVKEKRTIFLVEKHKAALKEKERLVIDELLLREGEMKLVELRRATRIPRTSLLRCIEGLEQRGLLLKKSRNGKPVIELVKK